LLRRVRSKSAVSGDYISSSIQQDTPPPHILRSNSLAARSKLILPLTLQRAWLGEHGPVRVQEPVSTWHQRADWSRQKMAVHWALDSSDSYSRQKQTWLFHTQIPSTLPEHHSMGGRCGCSMMGSPFWVRCRLVICCMTCDF
jgi:hypothetical protein